MLQQIKALGSFVQLDKEKCLSLLYVIYKSQLKADQVLWEQNQSEIDGMLKQKIWAAYEKLLDLVFAERIVLR